MTRVVAFVPDLMDRSKVAAAAPDAVFVRRVDDLASTDADVVALDLTRPGAVEALSLVSGPGRRVIGFANHTQRQLMEDARAAGCDLVLPRSDFFSRLTELLGP